MFRTQIAHRTLKYLYQNPYRQFLIATKQVKKTQLQILQDLLQIASKSVFGQKHQLHAGLQNLNDILPITQYQDWSDYIQEQKTHHSNILSPQCSRYQPTSGSTSQIKWIPYTTKLLEEFDRAASVWLYDMYQQYPQIARGPHYWSLSWLPDDLRQQTTSADDLQLFPWWKRWFMSNLMAIPPEIAHVSTLQQALLATLVYLVRCRQLSFISVWSPTFALSLLDILRDKKHIVSKILFDGVWNDKSLSNLLRCPRCKITSRLLDAWDGAISPELFHKFWPNLALLSCWDTASATPWAQQLQKLLPQHSVLQGKGLWATEGVVTIPVQGKYPLAITSHFYEFRCLQSQQIYPSWELQIGQEVQPIITTGSGIWRYALPDRLVVENFLNACPCLRFLGRIRDVDLVGEKISYDFAQKTLDYLHKNTQYQCITLLACVGDEQQKPFYSVLCQPNPLKSHNTSQIAQLLEEQLLQQFHYRLARQLEQLAPAQAIISPTATADYHEYMTRQGMIAGSIKIEPVVLCRDKFCNFG